jgi:hypothetical protein
VQWHLPSTNLKHNQQLEAAVELARVLREQGAHLMPLMQRINCLAGLSASLRKLASHVGGMPVEPGFVCWPGLPHWRDASNRCYAAALSNIERLHGGSAISVSWGEESRADLLEAALAAAAVWACQERAACGLGGKSLDWPALVGGDCASWDAPTYELVQHVRVVERAPKLRP